jgi:hypothetical protein
MQARSHFLGNPVAIAVPFLAALVLVGCERSKQAASAPSAAATPSAATEKVFIVFEGPWAFATDPRDAKMIMALAPKTKGHHDLNVAASNNSNLAAGVYDLSVPTQSGAMTNPVDASFAQAKIDSKSLQRAIDDKSGRYVIRLPKPEAFVASARYRSRVGPTYPPDSSTEQNYATAVSLRYGVSGLSGFSLSGTPDSGTFNPLLLQVDSPTIRFAIEPAQDDDPLDRCDIHSREAFRDLIKFLGLTLYVDFPDNPADCHNKDPQSTSRVKAQSASSTDVERVVALRTDPQTSSVGSYYLASFDSRGAAKGVARVLTAAVYYFHMTGADCRAPILILTTTP